MTDARRTPKEIRAENRKSWRDDIGVAGKIIGTVLGCLAILAMCFGTYSTLENAASKDDLRTMKSEILTITTTKITEERLESEKSGYAYIKATEDRLKAADDSHEKDIQYIKQAVDANGRRLEKVMDKLDRIRR